ncbi:MAG: flippase-like domain-containing protein [Anaerolineales bacterium]|nr:flippase-like domain-containing protein [Anaerolineales bacterium]
MKKWQFWLGVAISAVFLYFALRGLQFKQVWDSIKGANYWWIFPGVLVYFIGVWIRTWRWHYLLKPIKSIPTNNLFSTVCIGYMGNNIYPARAGEILRAVVLKRKERIPVSVSLATIIVERVFDGVVMLAFVFLNLPELAKITGDSGYAGNIQNLATWGAVAFIGALVVFLLAAMFPEPTAKLSEWTIGHVIPDRFRENVNLFTHKFLDGLQSLRSPKHAVMVFLTSVVIWLLETGKYWFVMHAFKFKVSFFALMLMNGVVNLATTIPSAPGYVGTFDAPGIAVLSAYGVAPTLATAYTLVLHVALWVPITALGAFYMWREGIHWNEDVRKEAQESDKNPDEELN